MTDTVLRRRLRREFRARRRALSHLEQQRHAQNASRVFMSSGLALLSRRVSGYFATDGELDPDALIARLRQVGAELVYPVIGERRRMTFRALLKGYALRLNRLGIWEPGGRVAPAAPPWSISIMLVPVVAFDSAGTRLGRGGGYYDAYLNSIGTRRPLLVGYAHACQEADEIPRARWDVPLDAVVTESKLHAFSHRAKRFG
ncbi:MAG: 5-formyltetrahydrofolate cyclo-ligase [Gammaproteobacteria bacterium]|nr:5-formyltetrahydrofolate cyclo-ligase [Gammaproteobacteria bacterium]